MAHGRANCDTDRFLAIFYSSFDQMRVFGLLRSGE